VNNFGVGMGTGFNLNFYNHHVDPSNTVNGKPIYYLNRVSNLTIDETSNFGYLALISCKNMTVRHLNIMGWGLGVVNTTYSTISNVTVSHYGGGGINFISSSHNTITDCTLYNNSNGITFTTSSNNNLIANCNIYNTTTYGISFGTIGSNPGNSNNIITNCNLYKCMYGLSIGGDQTNIVMNCHAHHNSIGFN
jgi:parallel beta-helix repeat protein